MNTKAYFIIHVILEQIRCNYIGMKSLSFFLEKKNKLLLPFPINLKNEPIHLKHFSIITLYHQLIDTASDMKVTKKSTSNKCEDAKVRSVDVQHIFR